MGVCREKALGDDAKARPLTSSNKWTPRAAELTLLPSLSVVARRLKVAHQSKKESYLLAFLAVKKFQRIRAKIRAKQGH